MARDEQLARAKALKLKFKKNLCSLLAQINCDHAYSTCPIIAAYHAVDHENVPPPLHLFRSLYAENVCINPCKATEIEAYT